MIKMKGLVYALSALLVGSQANPTGRFDGPLAISALTPPRAAPVRRGALLAYELRVTNRSAGSLILRRIAVEDPATRELLARFAGRDLDNRTVDVDTGAQVTEIMPGRTVLIYLEVNAVAAPDRLAHDILYERKDGRGEGRASIDIAQQPGLVILGAPFRSGTWVAVHQPDWPRGHRRVLTGSSWNRTIPGRFAIDFVGVDCTGHVTRGDADRPADAVGYGEPVLAGADAVVVATRSDMGESGSISRNPAHNEANGAGNFVALDLGEGRYAFYEHLRPRSIRVAVGQRVHRGESIGELGFSGDSTGPHLHLHVADGPDRVHSEGLPFALDHFAELGRYARISDLGSTRWSAAPRPARREWPYYNVVLEF